MKLLLLRCQNMAAKAAQDVSNGETSWVTADIPKPTNYKLLRKTSFVYFWDTYNRKVMHKKGCSDILIT